MCLSSLLFFPQRILCAICRKKRASARNTEKLDYPHYDRVLLQQQTAVSALYAQLQETF